MIIITKVESPNKHEYDDKIQKTINQINNM